MSKVSNDAPILKGQNTQAQLYDQGITYNQPGLTYNNIGIAYGGVYNADWDNLTSISFAKNIIPTISIAIDKGQGFTIPILSLAENIKPMIYTYSDIYKPGSGTITPPSGNSGYLIGILGLTYP